jgi:3,4-dihydroxy 2-butanone 4-phosphate synthase / GTP cyclohydrolase II
MREPSDVPEPSGPGSVPLTLPSNASVDAVGIAMGRLHTRGVVMIVDDESPDSEIDFACAAQFCDARTIEFMRRHGTGVVTVPMTAGRGVALGIPLTEETDATTGQAVAQSVDARVGISSGDSDEDRAHTARLLANPRTRREDLVVPGHVFPVAARPGGVLVRAGHAEAAVDLCRAAGLEPVAVLCPATNSDGTMARLPELLALAQNHGLAIVSVRDVIAYRMAGEKLVDVVSKSELPTRHGTFAVRGYRVHGTDDDLEHVALTLGEVDDGRPVLVRVQTACFAADVLGSLACDCRSKREAALRLIAEEGRGVLVYLRSKGDAVGVCQVQLRRGELEEAEQRAQRGTQREYGIGAQILRDLGVTRVRLLTNYQHRLASLYGLDVVDHVPLDVVDLPPAPLDVSVLEQDRYRELAGSFPTGVTIVTTRDPADGSVRGLTSQTFVGLSTEPPLVMVSLARTSRTVPALLRSRSFVVNFLGSGAAELSDLFASKAEDKFEGLEWTPSVVAGGAPILREHSVAYAECTVVEVHEGGDHWIFVGRVDGGETLGGTPLMYHRRIYAPWPVA